MGSWRQDFSEARLSEVRLKRGRDIRATTAERVSTPSFSKIWIRCVFTVARPIFRHSPISRLVRPQQSRSMTSSSREVRP